MNQQIDNAIGGYEDCHRVNRITDILRPIADIDWAGKWRILRAIELDGATHTREELVEVMSKSYNRDMTAREALGAALSALEAIGAVKVRA